MGDYAERYREALPREVPLSTWLEARRRLSGLEIVYRSQTKIGVSAEGSGNCAVRFCDMYSLGYTGPASRISHLYFQCLGNRYGEYATLHKPCPILRMARIMPWIRTDGLARAFLVRHTLDHAFALVSLLSGASDGFDSLFLNSRDVLATRHITRALIFVFGPSRSP